MLIAKGYYSNNVGRFRHIYGRKSVLTEILQTSGPTLQTLERMNKKES